jgi:hypothetical protein
VVRGLDDWYVHGTFATGDTIEFKINNKALKLTVGTTTTVDQILADLVDMVNGDDANGTETRSALGPDVGEWANLTASANTTTDHLTFTGDELGRPIGTVTVSVSSAAGQVDSHTTTAETSPNHFSNAANWSGNAVPVDGDDVVFDHQAVSDCLYGLSPVSLTPATLTVTDGFTYAIGLSEVNTSMGVSFDEWSDTYLTVDGSTLCNINAASAGKIKIDFGSTVSTIIVQSSGQTDEPNVPPVLIRANRNTTTLTVQGGIVGVNYETKVTGSLDVISVIGDATVVSIGNSTTLVTLNVDSATVDTSSSCTNLYVAGGVVTYNSSGTITAAKIDGGTLVHVNTGTITTLTLLGGTLDCSLNNRARSITNTLVYAKSSILDPLGSVAFGANGFDLYCRPSDVTLNLPSKRKYVVSVVS